MARDFNFLCETEFPSRQVGEYLNRAYIPSAAVSPNPSEDHLSSRRAQIIAAKSVLVHVYVLSLDYIIVFRYSNPMDRLWTCIRSTKERIYSYVWRRQVVQEVLELLSKDRSPLCNMRPTPLLEPSIQRHLTHFSLITHGFGAPTVVSALATTQSVLTEMLKSMSAGAGPGAQGLGACGPSGQQAQLQAQAAQQQQQHQQADKALALGVDALHALDFSAHGIANGDSR